MALGSWEDVIGAYENLYRPSKYGWEAEQLLSLIPTLRKSQLVTELIPGTSHLTLFLELSGKQTEINIFPEFETENFSVRLYNPSQNKILEERILPRDDILRGVEEYILKLKNDVTIP